MTDTPAEQSPRRDAPIAALRSAVMDLDRVDLTRLVAAEAASAREEQGLEWKPGPDGLPPHCPVTPLGKRGGTFYFLTPDKELSALPAGNFGQAHLDGLFAPETRYLVALWGSASKSNKVKVNYELVRRDLMDACARRGVFDPADAVRGRGAWLGPDGELVLHLGDQVLVGEEARDPGLIGDHVYPGRPRLTPPAADGGKPARDAAARLLAALEGWPWRRGALDARLLLGWMVASLLGAAVGWRPQVMLTGDAGMGKSTLQHLLKAVLGDRLLDVADATAAGLYQTLEFDALGVAFDEFENEDEARGAAVMRLARLASSGARLVRGGADGVPSNYQARGAFLFSAINPPSMRPAELSRTTILGLQRPRPGAKPPVLEKPGAIGAHLLARVINQWPFWPERLEQVRATLAALGHANRSQDQLGTLLACADLALSDGLASTDELAELVDDLRPTDDTAGIPNWRRCLNHLLASQPDPWRTAKHKAVGQALQAWAARVPDDWSVSTLRNHLALCGLALVSDEDGRDWLGVPARHPALARLFEGTDWSARRGADGAWTNALQQIPGAGGFEPDPSWKRDRFRIGGARESGLLIRLTTVLEEEP